MKKKNQIFCNTRLRAFTMAEALMMLMISSLIIVATMPVITKKKRTRIVNKKGTPGGWVCLRSMMPCTFTPPATAKNYVIYFDDEAVPSFTAQRLGTLKILAGPQGSTSGCNGHPDLNRYMQDYPNGKAVLSGTFCTGSSLVRISY